MKFIQGTNFSLGRRAPEKSGTARVVTTAMAAKVKCLFYAVINHAAAVFDLTASQINPGVRARGLAGRLSSKKARHTPACHRQPLNPTALATAGDVLPVPCLKEPVECDIGKGVVEYSVGGRGFTSEIAVVRVKLSPALSRGTAVFGFVLYLNCHPLTRRVNLPRRKRFACVDGFDEERPAVLIMTRVDAVGHVLSVMDKGRRPRDTAPTQRGGFPFACVFPIGLFPTL